MEKLVLKYQNLSALLVGKYQTVCEFLGVRDTVETRVFMAVTTGVGLFYACYILDRLFRLFYSVGDLLIAVVHQ